MEPADNRSITHALRIFFAQGYVVRADVAYVSSVEFVDEMAVC